MLCPDARAEAARLHEEYRAKIERYVRRKARNRDAVDDLVSRVFLNAAEALDAGKGPQSHESGWLYRIAHNLIIDEYRWSEKYQQVDIDEVGEWLVASESGIDAEAIDIRTAIESGARRFTPEQAAAFGFWVEGCTGEELGEAMNMTSGAAKALLHRAKEKIIPDLSAATGRSPDNTTVIRTMRDMILMYGPQSTRQISQRSRISLKSVINAVFANREFVPVGTTNYRRATLNLYGIAGIHDQGAA